MLVTLKGLRVYQDHKKKGNDRQPMELWSLYQFSLLGSNKMYWEENWEYGYWCSGVKGESNGNGDQLQMNMLLPSSAIARFWVHHAESRPFCHISSSLAVSLPFQTSPWLSACSVILLLPKNKRATKKEESLTLNNFQDLLLILPYSCFKFPCK